MKAYLAKLSARTWALLTVPLVVIAYPVFTIALHAAIRAVVPEVVRTVLDLL